MGNCFLTNRHVKWSLQSIWTNSNPNQEVASGTTATTSRDLSSNINLIIIKSRESTSSSDYHLLGPYVLNEQSAVFSLFYPVSRTILSRNVTYTYPRTFQFWSNFERGSSGSVAADAVNTKNIPTEIFLLNA